MRASRHSAVELRADTPTRRLDHGVAFGGFGWRRSHDPVFGPSRNRSSVEHGFEASVALPKASLGSLPEPNQRFEATATSLSASIGDGDSTSVAVPHPRRWTHAPGDVRKQRRECL